MQMFSAGRGRLVSLASARPCSLISRGDFDGLAGRGLYGFRFPSSELDAYRARCRRIPDCPFVMGKPITIIALGAPQKRKKKQMTLAPGEELGSSGVMPIAASASRHDSRA
jgi:hypothetical protein